MHTLKLILCWNTFWFYYTTQSFWVWVYQHGTSWLSNICPLFFAKNAPNLSDCESISCAQPSSDHPHRFSIGFRSGLWLGLSKTSIFFWWSHSFVDFDVCFGLLLCWKMKFLFIFSFLAEAWRFCANIDRYLELFIIPSTLTKAPVPAKEKQPQSMMLPPPCFTVGMLLLWWCAVLFFHQTYLLELWPKCSTLVSSDHNTFSHMVFLPPYPLT